MKNNCIHGNILIKLGLLLIAAALLLSAGNLLANINAARTATATAIDLQTAISVAETAETDSTEAAYPDYHQYPQMSMPTAQVDDINYIGVLSIEALDLQLPIAADWSYKELKNSPCRYFGSAYSDDLVVAGHNYAAHFGKLHNLRSRDSISFTDMDGNEFRYRVSAVEVLDATAVDEMCSGDWPLTLFTCTVGGQTRLAIRCDKI